MTREVSKTRGIEFAEIDAKNREAIRMLALFREKQARNDNRRLLAQCKELQEENSVLIRILRKQGGMG